ncbi:hypothetical protein ASE63_22865 [Bosea sp. Root381]|uniref:IclR family transcriptional regulator domain-containing protein n=1 Tax=Bosea sp. Root381 TaxID=1736524 RepID=UPI0006FDFEC8|nr:IclR family transcriptional regulator C-terminal domain-containing protein [Bosea sp. Root381]KRE07541.1 hypothetical protein ASE63_22865 [Bosea sp. Root381]
MYQPLLTTTTNMVPLHATASGKSWPARLPRTQLRDLDGRNGGFGELGQYGPNAVRSFHQLFVELDRTAACGFGIAVSKAEPGVTAVAAAIFSGADRSAWPAPGFAWARPASQSLAGW